MTGRRLHLAKIPDDVPGYFDSRAARYDTAYDREDADGHALRSRFDGVVRLVGRGPGELLDAGMGPGRLCAELDSLGWTVSGIDAAEEMVRMAQAQVPGARERLRQASIEQLPFSDRSFDVVTATGVLEYVDVERALSEIARVLRPDGRAVVSYPNPQALYGLWKTRVWYPAARSTKRVLRRPDPQMPHGAGELPPQRFHRALTHAGLIPRSRLHTSYLPLLTPLDLLLPVTSARVGRRLEGGGEFRGRLFATQIVYEAQKAETPASGEGEEGR